MNPKLYFIFMTLALLSFNCLNGVNIDQAFEELRISTKSFASHYLINKIIIYIGIFILSICLYKYELVASKPESSKELVKINKNNEIRSQSISYEFLSQSISKKSEEKKSSNKNIFLYLLVIFCWTFIDDIIVNYRVIFQDLDFWMFELIFLWYLSIKMFKYKIYKHQFLGLSLCIFSGLLKVGCIIVTFVGYKNEVNEKDLPIFYKNNKPIFRICIGIILYVLFIALRAYIYMKLKWYMDKKNVSSNSLFIIYGLFGILIYTIISIVGTLVACPDHELSQYLCKVKYGNNNKKYLENFISYTSNYEVEKLTQTIPIIIFGTLFYFIKEYFSVLIIKHFTPVHVIISVPIEYLLEKVVLMINTKINNNTIFYNNNKNKIIKFFFNLFGDFFCVVGFLIYLEIIVLKCCKCDYDIRDSMIRRSLAEIKLDDSDEESGIQIIMDQYIIKDTNTE
jgi:hypothetical protein